MHTYLEKRQSAKNVARFYRMTVMPNLFGEWTLCREWGRVGQGGQVRMDWFDSEDQAIGALIALEAVKRRRDIGLSPSNSLCSIGKYERWKVSVPSNTLCPKDIGYWMAQVNWTLNFIPPFPLTALSTISICPKDIWISY